MLKESQIVLSKTDLRGEDYSNRKLMQFSAVGCRFEACDFSGVDITDASFGAGQLQSEYYECNFNDARMHMSAGGYARFVRRSFQDVDIRHWTCFAVELIDCAFSGKLQDVIFNGSVPQDRQRYLNRRVNEFTGNDFFAAEFVNVTFRTGIDLSRQKLPPGSQYIYLPDAARALMRAQSFLSHWQDNTEWRGLALLIIDVLRKEAEKGQSEMFLNIDDYATQRSFPPQVVEKVFELLRAG